MAAMTSKLLDAIVPLTGRSY